MQMDKLTSKFQSALSQAQSLAVSRDHQFIEPAHLLLSMLDQQGGTVRPLLNKVGVVIPQLRDALNSQINGYAEVSGTAGEMHLSTDLGKLLNLCDKYAQKKRGRLYCL